MSNIEVTKKVKELLDLFTEDDTSDNIFASAGPSDEFMSTHLEAVGVSKDDVAQMKSAINTAIDRKDVQTADKIASAAGSVFKVLKGFLL